MKLNNPTCKESVRQIVSYIRSNNVEQAINKISYLTGMYGAFYMIAVLYELTEEEQIKLIDGLQQRCDPER